MSKTTLLLILAFIICVALLVIIVFQVNTPITKPITNAIQATTSLDFTEIKDKIIGSLAGTTALLTGCLTALVYGFWSRGKQLASEIQSKLQWKTQATDTGVYATALAEENAQSKSLLTSLGEEKTQLTTQLTGAKSQLELTAKDLERKTIEAETLSKQAAANFQSALPTNTLYKNAQTGAQIITVEKKVVV
jgi:hypothetical protein